MLTDHRPFAFNCSTAIFPADEIAALVEAGGRLEALAAGKASPADAEEKHFLKVDREEAEPETLLERAWVRLKGRREFEREQAEALPPDPEPDYGMIEFDKDRCWW
jgi:uncharacterized protein YifE (UPF0438 family)